MLRPHGDQYRENRFRCEVRARSLGLIPVRFSATSSLTRLLGPIYKFVGFGTGESDILLQFVPATAAVNLEVWLSAEKRLERWKQRGQGGIPKDLALSYSNVKGEPLYDELQAEFGALSDFAGHFTAEYFWRYSWEARPLPGGGRDFSFGLNVGAIRVPDAQQALRADLPGLRSL